MLPFLDLNILFVTTLFHFLNILYYKIRLQHNSIIFETILVLMMAAPQNA